MISNLFKLKNCYALPLKMLINNTQIILTLYYNSKILLLDRLSIKFLSQSLRGSLGGLHSK